MIHETARPAGKHFRIREMKFRGWDRIDLVAEDEPGCATTDKTGGHRVVKAIAPVIISASRATDIPSLYADWFMERFRRGYVRWTNPFNNRCQYVSFAKARVIVFWSKNPRNLMKFLPEIDRSGVNYYVHFTLNDYEAEKLEPAIPPLNDRIQTFIDLAALIGKDRVIWRSDPLILSDTLPVDELMSRLKRIGDRIHNSTERLIFSFVEIPEYRRVEVNLRKAGFRIRGFTHEEKMNFAEQLCRLNERWGLELMTCAEDLDLSPYGICRGRCIDNELMTSLFSHDKNLMDFLLPPEQTGLVGFDAKNRSAMKDPGQRRECGCIRSKDIGQYNTCTHLCAYCYANSSPELAIKNHERYKSSADSGIFPDRIAVPDGKKEGSRD